MAIEESEQTKVAISGKSVSGIGVRGDSTTGFAAVHGHGGKNGVWGYSVSPNDSGVYGSNDGCGVAGFSKDGFGVRGDSTHGFAAVHGHGKKNGVWGYSVSPNDSGVYGSNDGSGCGVAGFSKDGFGVRGDSTNGFAAVHGHGKKNGVWGYSVSPNDSGVYGSNDGSGTGVAGFSKDGIGIRGQSTASTGVEGKTEASDQNGIFGINTGSASVSERLGRPAGSGVWGHTKAEGGAGVVGSVEGDLTRAAGIVGIGKVAGKFFGDVLVSGDIQLTGADLAEQFDITEPSAVEPGTVMVLNPDGGVCVCASAYDTRVVGVVSGAGAFRPGLILDNRETEYPRLPIALMGKVYCKVDADIAPIEVGDLLTTSPTPGHAMKATSRQEAFGAVVGKALQKLSSGKQLIPVLIVLQ